MRKFSVFILIYTLAVILFGAYVRISGSGAGCGAHWPSCEGEVVPNDLLKNHAKAIEYTHRVTSGLLGIFVIILWYGIFRDKQFSKSARRWSKTSLILIIIEGLLGASLVLFKWVGMDESRGRAIMMPFHLGNTYLLLGALTLTVLALKRPERVLTMTANRAMKISALMLSITGMFGALAALGDTLFPGTRGFVTEGHTYLKLRNIHPIIAVLTIGHILAVAIKRRDFYSDVIFSRYHICDAIVFMTALQGILGVVNIALSAPAYMQILHLLVSDALWILFSLWLFGTTTSQVKTVSGPANLA